MKMVFHESFGSIPLMLLRAIKKYNVSPSDFYMLEDAGMSHLEMLDHIKDNSVTGMYRYPMVWN